jgi:predicted MPP superfamily phosphohydrolase
VHGLAKGLLATAAVGASTLAYAAGYEVRAFRLRRLEVPLLHPGSAPIRVLHVSDLHVVPGQDAKRRWVQGLDELEPDLVVNTGDNCSHRDAVPHALEAYGPLLERPGVFVLGSNDYYAPRLRNPVRYLWTHEAERRPVEDLPWKELRDGFTDAGWLDLDNARGELAVAGRRLVFTGVDDPHIGRDRYADVAGPPDPSAAIGIAVVHAPYERVLDAFTTDGWPLILAGHTHGGQVCLPFYGALVTNCDLDTARAKGLSSHAVDSRTAALHVSAGLGTSRFAPVRLACRPEATLLTLVAR